MTVHLCLSFHYPSTCLYIGTNYPPVCILILTIRLFMSRNSSYSPICIVVRTVSACLCMYKYQPCICLHLCTICLSLFRYSQYACPCLDSMYLSSLWPPLPYILYVSFLSVTTLTLYPLYLVNVYTYLCLSFCCRQGSGSLRRDIITGGPAAKRFRDPHMPNIGKVYANTCPLCCWSRGKSREGRTLGRRLKHLWLDTSPGSEIKIIVVLTYSRYRSENICWLIQ